MQGRAITTALVLTTAFVLTPRPAYGNDPAAAQVLFEQAQALMRQERWAEACPKLEESQRLDPGDGTLLHLAACREHEGRIATAWALYQDALVAAKRSNHRGRMRVAQERVEVLAPRLHRIRLKVSAGDRRLTGFKVMRDDTTVGGALWDDPFPIDPGPHVIKASADGHKPWSQSIEIASSSGETTVEIPLLDPEPAAPDAPREPPRPTRIEEATRGDTQRVVGIALAGVGVAGLAVGSIFGALAFSKENEANTHCKEPDYARCSQQGVDAGETSTAFGNVSTVAFVAGAALSVGGAVLYFTAPERKRLSLGLGPSSVVVGGRF